MHFLDEVPIHRDDPKIVELHEIFIRAYDEEYDALALAGQVGLLKADIDRYPKLRETWWSILEESAREGQLRKLVDVALRDPTRENWHVQIRAVVEVPEGSLLVNAPAAAPEEEPAARPRSAKNPEVGSTADLWELGSTLRVRFLDGTKGLKAQVEDAARQWIEYANLKLEFGDDPDSEVRISFKEPGNWSYQGKTALMIPKKNPTLNFGWLKGISKEEAGRVVRHEFGHVLGMQHEHGNPASTLKWNKKEVYDAFPGGREQADRMIFAIWPPAYFPVHKVFDRESVMMYHLPANYFADGKAIVPSAELSALDKQFAAALYPLRRGN